MEVVRYLPLLEREAAPHKGTPWETPRSRADEERQHRSRQHSSQEGFTVSDSSHIMKSVTTEEYKVGVSKTNHIQ